MGGLLWKDMDLARFVGRLSEKCGSLDIEAPDIEIFDFDKIIEDQIEGDRKPCSADCMFFYGDDVLVFLELKGFDPRNTDDAKKSRTEIILKSQTKAAETAYIYKRCLSQRSEFKKLKTEFWYVIGLSRKYIRDILNSHAYKNTEMEQSIKNKLRRFEKVDKRNNKIYYDCVHVLSIPSFEKKLKLLSPIEYN